MGAAVALVKVVEDEDGGTGLGDDGTQPGEDRPDRGDGVFIDAWQVASQGIQDNQAGLVLLDQPAQDSQGPCLAEIEGRKIDVEVGGQGDAAPAAEGSQPALDSLAGGIQAEIQYSHMRNRPGMPHFLRSGTSPTHFVRGFASRQLRVVPLPPVGD